MKVYKFLITLFFLYISPYIKPTTGLQRTQRFGNHKERGGSEVIPVSQKLKNYGLWVTGLTRVVKPITAVLKISVYACFGVMTSPSEHVVITIASVKPNYSLLRSSYA